MRSNFKRGCFFGILLQLVPLFLQAQVETISRGPLIPDPIPPAPVRVVSPSPGVTLSLPLQQPILVPSTGKPPHPNMSLSPSAIGGGGVATSPSNEEISGDLITNILNFWFGNLTGPDSFPPDKMAIWSSDSSEIDHQITNNFGQEIINAHKGEYNSWRNTPRGRLALILLLDQFPRRIYRNQSRSFMFDRMARALVLEGIQKGDDKQLYPIERAFFYQPLEHSEDLGIQNLSVASYQQLLAESPEGLKHQMQDFLRLAIMHQQQIALFGRFPHRNAILGRESTPEETQFLMRWRNH